MEATEIIFWASLACVAYAYLGYPLLMAAAKCFWPAPVRRTVGCAPSVSIIIAAYNEEQQIGRRIAELSNIVREYPNAEVILVSDGSTDGTARAARETATVPVQVIELPERQGKAAALNAGWAAARHDVLVFADVRQTWSPDALAFLVENFADPSVGAVSGDLVVESGPGAVAGVRVYWRYEKWLRLNESRFDSMTGLTGSICAVRRNLYQPMPPGTLLDDVHWPLRVAMQGYRVVHDERAKAFDRLPPQAGGEFRRKIRTLSGNYQLLAALPASLLPWKNRLWLQFISHKVLRLAAPWALLAMLATSGLLLSEGLYQLLFAMQIGFYLLALFGLCSRARGRVSSLAGSFVLLNSAAFIAFWFWVSGRATASWHKVAYSAMHPAHGGADAPLSGEGYSQEPYCPEASP